MDYELWINRANDKILELKIGYEFVLKDLFEGVDWNSLPRGDKLGFGKYFKNEVKDGRIPNISYAGKAQNNSAKYIKTI